MKPGKMMKTVLAISVVMFLTACSGGGDSPSGTSPSPSPSAATTISGPVGVGAPLVGIVTLKDSTGALLGPVQLSADGSYLITLSGAVCPCMLKAEGAVGPTAYTMYSVVMANDSHTNYSITPLTDLITSNATGKTAEQLYNQAPTDFSKLTSGNLTAAQTALLTSVTQPLQASGVNVTETVDLLHAPFTPGSHTGLDAVLDTLKVTYDVNANQATITNVANNVSITDSLSSTTDTATLSGTNTGSFLTETNAIAAQFATMQNLFKTSKPAANNPTLLGLFDQAGFLWSGRNLTAFITLLLDPSLTAVGLRLDVGQVSLTSSTQATVPLVLTLGDGKSLSGTWFMTKVNGVWLARGDQRKTFSGVDVRIQRLINLNTQTTTVNAGLDFSNVEDDTAAQTISYAVITGKGLPTTLAGRDGQHAGLLMVKDPSFLNASFYIAQPPYKGTGIATTPVINPLRWNIFVLTDETVIQSFTDNENYLFTFFSDNNTPLDFTDDVQIEQVTNTLRKPPLNAVDRAAAQFPTITGPLQSVVDTYAQGGTPITVTWTMPTFLRSDYVEVGRSTGSGLGENSPEGNVSAAALSRTLDPLNALQLGQTVTGTHVSVGAWDVPGRFFETMLIK